MGIDGLYKFINKNIPDIYKNISIYDIKGQSCIIDGMQHIYSQLIYMRSRGKEIITPDGKNISHIHGLINSLTYYLKNGIIPIFIFDGKAPDIKRKKIEERRKNLKDNIKKLKELEEKKNILTELINSKLNDYNLEEDDDNNNVLNVDTILQIIKNEMPDDTETNDNKDNLIFGTPPDNFNLEEEMQKINNIQEEYHKIYKKSIVLKDYYILDWIMILELLGLPVIKAKGEADPLCAYLLKNNTDIFGIISDDSDMLVFGAPVLMRKSINQQFTVIKLDLLLYKISCLLSQEFKKNIDFTMNNLVEFSILLGTDYGNFTINKKIGDSLNLLIYYFENNCDVTKIIPNEQLEYFFIIKKYYTEFEFDNSISYLLEKPIWNKPKVLQLKMKLLEFKVDEDYIDKNNEILDLYYSKYKKYKKNKNRFTYNSFKEKNLNLTFDTANKNIFVNNDIQIKNYNNSLDNDTSSSSSDKNHDNDNNVNSAEQFFKMDD